MRETSVPDAAVDVDTGGHRLPLAVSAVRALARFVLRRERVPDAMLSIAFVSRRGIAAMNREHLGHRGATDVISFALDRPAAGAPLVGDVYIAPEVVRQQARRLAVPVREELARVVVHGVLHTLGHDHPDTDARTSSPMWRRQEQLLAAARSGGVW
jgi:probable rRNA maturation factor